MDLYRYFHPHHNPRLRATPMRLQELAELEQAAIELGKALKRAQIRTSRAPIGPLNELSFSEALRAAQILVEQLSELTRAHPGDDRTTMKQLLRERKDAPGWETWTKLLRQRLELMQDYEEYVPPRRIVPAQDRAPESPEANGTDLGGGTVVPLRKVQNR